jgi:hypothetical protein
MELSTFITAYAIAGVVICICVLGITSECVEASPFSRPEMSVPIWFIGAVFCGIIWPLTCILLLISYFHILLNKKR